MKYRLTNKGIVSNTKIIHTNCGNILITDLPSPDELFKKGSQAHRMYDTILGQGSVSNFDLNVKLKILKYTNIVSKIREKLKKYGYNIKATESAVHENLYYYSIVKEKANG